MGRIDRTKADEDVAERVTGGVRMERSGKSGLNRRWIAKHDEYDRDGADREMSTRGDDDI